VTTPDLKAPANYINRELSALAFNARVLAMAENKEVPLLERLKYVCIVSTNLDEFFEIRVSGLKQRLEAGLVAYGPELKNPQQILDEVREMAHEIIAKQYELLNQEILPELEQSGVRFVRRDAWSDAQKKWLYDFFHREIEPALSPISLDSARPFPRILNKSLNFIVGLDGIHAFGRRCKRAIVQAPRLLPRLIKLPKEISGQNEQDYVFLSSIIHAFVAELFQGMEINGCYQFRVTRNSDLYVDDEEVENLMAALEGELASRRYGAAVRLEIANDCPAELTSYLLAQFDLTTNDLFPVDGPVNLNRLISIYDAPGMNNLKFSQFQPGLPIADIGNSGMFSAMRQRDILLQHPYQSFNPVLELVRSASQDPQVISIKLTLYRTGPDSPIVEHLLVAARANKEVTVLVELRARFDEAANIELANRLQEAGAHVVYGIVGFKTHCKMMLIVRREQGKLMRYAHLSTGNYHDKTARAYTDYGLFTTDAELTSDVHNVFMQLTSMMETPQLRKLIQAPFKLHEKLIGMINNESNAAKKGQPARIIAKLNALVEPEIIRALYAASIAGVQIDLILRGICCLRPGMPGISENIRVTSIIGRFLEHSRVYYFLNSGQENIYCSSADWMDRNMFRRIEVCFPIEAPELKQRLIDDLNIYLDDNMLAWSLNPDGSYSRNPVEEGQPLLSSQDYFLEKLADRSSQ
jgi:polyphosphate kinase